MTAWLGLCCAGPTLTGGPAGTVAGSQRETESLSQPSALAPS